jgi:hypothetical protein
VFEVGCEGGDFIVAVAPDQIGNACEIKPMLHRCHIIQRLTDSSKYLELKIC